VYLQCDASDFAIAAVLAHISTVGFYSMKLASSQLHWAEKEKEMYAVVADPLKWSGVINFSQFC